MKNITSLSVSELSLLLQRRQISSFELTQAYLDNIEQNRTLNAFITVCDENVLEMARRSDERRSKGDAVHSLDGIPFAVKDNLCTSGIRTTCASKMLADFVPPYTATAVSRLLSVGGILIGKTNMDEFGMGSHSQNSFFGGVKNPLNTKLSPGGSSGGSAVAVAAKLAPYALGTDTGGSVRLPAAYCGVVGMKPTYGAISRYGLIAFASSLDHVGIISDDISTNAYVLDVIKGKDKFDSTSLSFDASVYPYDVQNPKGIRIGVPTLTDVSDEVRAAVESATAIFEKAGAKISTVTLPPDNALVSAYYVISAAEASSNLARYDGVRYGYRAEDTRSIDELFISSRTEAFGDEVKRRILLGTYCLSEGSKQKYYQKAIEARQKISCELSRLLSECDVILSPVSAENAPMIEDIPSSPIDVYRRDAFTVAANLSGLPAISVPSGKSAVQLIGNRFSEGLLYSLGSILTGEVTP